VGYKNTKLDALNQGSTAIHNVTFKNLLTERVMNMKAGAVGKHKL